MTQEIEHIGVVAIPTDGEKHEPVAWQAQLTDGSWKIAEGPLLSEIQAGYLSTKLRPLYPASTVEALTAERDAALARVAKLEAALKFYADAWCFTTNPKRPGLEWKPKESLLEDCGNIARSALQETTP